MKYCGCYIVSLSIYLLSRCDPNAGSVPVSYLTYFLHKVHTFYEAVGYMISAQPNKPQQEKLIAKLMELPNNAVRLVLLSDYH